MAHRGRSGGVDERPPRVKGQRATLAQNSLAGDYANGYYPALGAGDAGRVGNRGASHMDRKIGLAACAAAALGVGAAAAIPAIADSTSPTVSAITVPGPSTDGVDAIAPAPSNIGGDWLVSDSAGTPILSQYPGGGQQPSAVTVSGSAIASSNLPARAVNDGSIDFLSDGTNLLALTGSGGTATAAVVATANAPSSQGSRRR